MTDLSLRERLVRVVWWLDWFPVAVPWRYPAADLLRGKTNDKG